MKFNWVDAVVLLVVIRGIYIGYKTGLSQEFFRILALVAAYYSALMFHKAAADFIVGHSLVTEKWALIISFIGIASVAFIIVIIGFKLLQRWVRLEFENALNIYGGAIAGGLRGLVVISLILFALFFIPDRFVKEQIYEKSFLGHYAIEYTPRVYSKLSRLLSSADVSGRSVRARFETEKRSAKGNGKKTNDAESVPQPQKGDGIDDVQDGDSAAEKAQDIDPALVKDENLVNRAEDK